MEEGAAFTEQRPPAMLNLEVILSAIVASGGPRSPWFPRDILTTSLHT